MREVFSSITDSSLKAVIQEEAYKTIQTQLRLASTINPYSQPTEAADVLENLGIITNPLAIEAHTHGAAKAIENDLYRKPTLVRVMSILRRLRELWRRTSAN